MQTGTEEKQISTELQSILPYLGLNHSSAGTSPLLLAIQAKDIPSIKLLINLGSDPKAPIRNHRDGVDNYPIEEAINTDDSALIHVLIQSGVHPDFCNGDCCPLEMAIERGKFNAVVALHQNGADIAKLDSNGDPLLITALRSANPNTIKILKYLLEQGLDPNDALNHQSRRPLGVAADRLSGTKGSYWSQSEEKLHAQMQPQKIQTLVESKADPNLADAKGKTPLRYAESDKVVMALIQAGANPELPDPLGKTPLMYASENYYSEALSALILSGACLDTCDKEGMTALLYAAQYRAKMNYSGTLTCLLSAGANPFIRSKEGKDFLTCATSGHYGGSEFCVQIFSEEPYLKKFPLTSHLLAAIEYTYYFPKEVGSLISEYAAPTVIDLTSTLFKTSFNYIELLTPLSEYAKTNSAAQKILSSLGNKGRYHSAFIAERINEHIKKSDRSAIQDMRLCRILNQIQINLNRKEGDFTPDYFEQLYEKFKSNQLRAEEAQAMLITTNGLALNQFLQWIDHRFYQLLTQTPSNLITSVKKDFLTEVDKLIHLLKLTPAENYKIYVFLYESQTANFRRILSLKINMLFPTLTQRRIMAKLEEMQNRTRWQQIYPYLITLSKWLFLGAITATVLYFTDGLIALPFLLKLGASVIAILTPLLAGLEFLCWNYLIKPLIPCFAPIERDEADEIITKDSVQSTKSTQDSQSTLLTKRGYFSLPVKAAIQLEDNNHGYQLALV